MYREAYQKKLQDQQRQNEEWLRQQHQQFLRQEEQRKKTEAVSYSSSSAKTYPANALPSPSLQRSQIPIVSAISQRIEGLNIAQEPLTSRCTHSTTNTGMYR